MSGDTELVAGYGILQGFKDNFEGEITFPVMETFVKVKMSPDFFEVYPPEDDPRLSERLNVLFEKQVNMDKVRDVFSNSFATSDRLPGTQQFVDTCEILLPEIASNLGGLKICKRGSDFPNEGLQLQKAWALYRRQKAQLSNVFAQDAARFRRLLDDGFPTFPEFCLAITHTEEYGSRARAVKIEPEKSAANEDLGALHALPDELLFPFQFNQEQHDVMKLSQSHPLVVVDGPPGTGKSQTIGTRARPAVCMPYAPPYASEPRCVQLVRLRLQSPLIISLCPPPRAPASDPCDSIIAVAVYSFH